MSKSLVGIVVLVSAIGGVAACGKTEKTKAETPASQLGVPASDVKYGEKATYETSVVGGLPPVPVETAVKPPRFTLDRKSTRLNSSHIDRSRMPSSA